MATNRHIKTTRITPSTRVILVISQEGKIIASKVVSYKGGRVTAYYKYISTIEKELKEKSQQDDIRCRVYSGTATSVGNFLHIFPEIASPF